MTYPMTLVALLENKYCTENNLKMCKKDDRSPDQKSRVFASKRVG